MALDACFRASYQMTYILGEVAPTTSFSDRAAVLVEVPDPPSKWRNRKDWIKSVAKRIVQQQRDPKAIHLANHQEVTTCPHQEVTTCPQPDVTTCPQPEGSIAGQGDTSATPTPTRPGFLSLPTELHLAIASYLPYHALEIMRKYRYNTAIRHMYNAAHATPTRPHQARRRPPQREYQILVELHVRDLFEGHWRALEAAGLDPYTHMSTGRIFFCGACQRLDNLHHFVADEIRRAIQQLEGLDKMDHRKCRALGSVQLWPGTHISPAGTAAMLKKLRELELGSLVLYSQSPPTAFPGSQPPGRLSILLRQRALAHHAARPWAWAHGACSRLSHSTSKLAHPPNTLTLMDHDFQQSGYPRARVRVEPDQTRERRTGIDAVATFEVPLFALHPSSPVETSQLARALKDSDVYLCRHIHAQSLDRLYRDALSPPTTAPLSQGEDENSFASRLKPRPVRNWAPDASFLECFTSTFNELSHWRIRYVDIPATTAITPTTTPASTTATTPATLAHAPLATESQFFQAQAIVCAIEGCGLVAELMRVRDGAVEMGERRRRRGGWAVMDEVVLRVGRRWGVLEGSGGGEWRAQVGC